MRFGVVQFLGSNCEEDSLHVIRNVLKEDGVLLWHERENLEGIDCVILPGGFSHGDYLRTGAMAARSPILSALQGFAERGGLVLGICNGFQILCEARLLPGAFVRNKNLQFICEDTELIVERADTPFTSRYQNGERIRMPIAHMEGHYYIDEEGLKGLEKKRQILFRYSKNPNGSVADIAGLINERGNVAGLMPHPERASEKILGGVDGLKMFQSLLQKK